MHLAQGEAGTQSLTQQGLFTSVAQSKTIDGFTITVATAYADANRAILGITIKQPDLSEYGNGGKWDFGQIKLITSDGSELPPTGLIPQLSASAGSHSHLGTSLRIEHIMR